MLAVVIVNRTGLVDGPCSYDVQVRVNAMPIWQGSVTHERRDGWAALLRRVADVAEASGARVTG